MVRVHGDCSAPDSSAFAYHRAPLDIREAGSEKLQRATVHDLSLAKPVATRVSAYLVQPDSVSVCPAILFLHCGQGDRATFLSDVLAHAEVGVE